MSENTNNSKATASLIAIKADSEQSDALIEIRRHRLMQICAITAIGLLVSVVAARGITAFIFASGLFCLIISLAFAYKHRVTVSAFILLASMSAMLFSLSLTGAGLFDLAVLGYPGVLIFSAILGGVGIFLSVLGFIIAQCLLIAWMTIEGIIAPSVPNLSWLHLVFILVIFTVTGFSVYILVQDIKRLMRSLQNENIKVEKSRVKIQHLAHHDPLTNLPNRLYGEALFAHSLRECEKKHQKLALLFIDLDNFKPINDALGHAAGDQLLIKLSLRVQKQLSADQHLIRFGGDEFLVLAPISNQQEREQLNALASNLIQSCSSVFELRQTQVMVSASIGIALAPKDGSDFRELCRKADIAMYKAKQDGRNTFHHYDEAFDKDSDDKFKLLQRMRPAVKNKEFRLFYQPMVDLSNEKFIMVEALLRWPQKDGSFIGPDKFIPLAESGGVINELGAWVIQEACLYCAKQRLAGFDELRVAVNLSVMQFKDGRLQSIVEEALKGAGLPAEALELELTESLLIDETDLIQKQLFALSQLGITIAIDDFGTGYSNLGYLRNFNASKLKIDRSFISGICVSQDDESLVAGIISMAKSLGLETVAEGIEDKQSLDKLKSLDCDIGQGFYWSKPVSGEALGELLSAT